jgi:hypothetical protein
MLTVDAVVGLGKHRGGEQRTRRAKRKPATIDSDHGGISVLFSGGIGLMQFLVEAP